MVKVVMLVESFTVGGAQRMVYELLKNLDRTYFDVHLVCCESKKNTELEKAVEGIVEINYLNIDGHKSISDYIHAFQYLDSLHPDVIHVHLAAQIFAIPWGLIHNKPVLLTLHSKVERGVIKKIEPMLKFGLKHGKMFLAAVSEENRKLARQYFGNIDSHCFCINNGIDTDLYYQKEHEYFTYINVARQDDNKNQAVIVQCFDKIHQKHPDTRLILVGDGPNHKALLKQVNELGLETAVTLTGSVSNVQDYYAVADVYVQASHTEAMPLSLLEAMAAGLPLISTNVGGIKDVISENGCLVDDGNASQLLEAMNQMYYMEKEQILKMAECGFCIVKKYSSLQMARQYEQVYKTISE